MTSPLSTAASAQSLHSIVGLGGRCGDDRAGWHIVARLRELLGPRDNVKLLIAATPADLLQIDQPCSRLTVIDACRGLTAPGQSMRCRWPAAPIQERSCSAGHHVSLSAALELLGSLGLLPAECELWCVEGRRFGVTEALSPDVAAACERVAQQISAEIR